MKKEKRKIKFGWHNIECQMAMTRSELIHSKNFELNWNSLICFKLDKWTLFRAVHNKAKNDRN